LQGPIIINVGVSVVEAMKVPVEPNESASKGRNGANKGRESAH
jgi:hypothetical protein